MHKLFHFRLCPHSRSIRILLAELGIAVEAIEERPWDWRPEFLGVNPSGELPVLAIEAGPAVCGSYAIAEFLSDRLADLVRAGEVCPLFPGSPEQRAEVRRLVDWFHGKMMREVTSDFLSERVYGHVVGGTGAAPDAAILRAARANLRYHLSYIAHLSDSRRWLSGDDMSFADLAAAAHISVADYLGEVPWDDYPPARAWYARLKSRPSVRVLLTDRVPGIAPSDAYADLDF